MAYFPYFLPLTLGPAFDSLVAADAVPGFQICPMATLVSFFSVSAT
jgi:hypothetical protein